MYLSQVLVTYICGGILAVEWNHRDSLSSQQLNTASACLQLGKMTASHGFGHKCSQQHYGPTCSFKIAALVHDKGVVFRISSSNCLPGDEGGVSQQGLEGLGTGHKGHHTQGGSDWYHIIQPHLHLKSSVSNRERPVYCVIYRCSS